MNDAVARIEACLATVQKTLDALTSRGDNEAAFDLAKAQYSASVRTSWPGNLGALGEHLGRIAANPKLNLTPEERAEIETAVQTIRDLLQM